MKFRTDYQPEQKPIKLNPGNPVVLFGSCFSGNIAVKMRQCQWTAVVPGGTLYNPLSIARAISLFLDNDRGKEKFRESLFFGNGIWNSRLFDSSFSSRFKEDCIEEFVIRQTEFLESLKRGKALIVTFGTSITYFLKESGEAVGNCHKQPATEFLKCRLSVAEIVELWSSLIENLQQRFPGLNIIFTVSPVRHLKDGFGGNSRSKAVLLLAVDELCDKYSSCLYFPAFEILNDDLRDYRFYAADLCHPSEEAIAYVWEKFIEEFLDDSGRTELQKGERVYKTTHHRSRIGALGKLLNQ